MGKCLPKLDAVELFQELFEREREYDDGYNAIEAIKSYLLTCAVLNGDRTDLPGVENHQIPSVKAIMKVKSLSGWFQAGSLKELMKAC